MNACSFFTMLQRHSVRHPNELFGSETRILSLVEKMMSQMLWKEIDDFHNLINDFVGESDDLVK